MRCGGAFLVLAALLFPAADKAAASETRTLSIYNIHTKETVTATFKRNSRYDRDGLKRMNHVMRDWRRNEPTDMDPALLDLIWELHQALGSQKPIHLISGYRSPATNQQLRRTRGGQARRSQHTMGKAADIHFPDVSVKDLRNSALVREIGGVGYYPTSGIPFVHVDTARVRSWPRLPRQELALLFPSGRTQHLPADGRPITRKDYETAMARLKARGETHIAAATYPPARPATPAPRPMLAAFTPGPAIPERAVPLPDRAPASEPRFVAAHAGGSDLVEALLSLGRMPAVRETADDGPLASMPVAYRPDAPLPAPAPRPETRATAPTLAPYERTQVAHAPEVDDDHPDQSSYIPFPLDPLLTDDSVAHSSEMALNHPDQSSHDHLFDEMDRSLPVRFAARSGFTGLHQAQGFSGPAVRSFYTEIANHGLARLAQAH
jgi:uncharacterized protein YcbK (DUF882 family)